MGCFLHGLFISTSQLFLAIRWSGISDQFNASNNPISWSWAWFQLYFLSRNCIPSHFSLQPCTRNSKAGSNRDFVSPKTVPRSESHLALSCSLSVFDAMLLKLPFHNFMKPSTSNIKLIAVLNQLQVVYFLSRAWVVVSSSCVYIIFYQIYQFLIRRDNLQINI